MVFMNGQNHVKITRWATVDPKKKKKKKKGMLVFHLQWPSFTSGDRGVNFLYF